MPTDPFFTAYRDRLLAFHTIFEGVFTDLPDAAVNWIPVPEANSLAALAFHVADAEDYWVGAMAGGDWFERNREAMFTITNQTASGCLARLAQSREHSLAVINRLTPADLGRNVPSPLHTGRSFTVAWSLLHHLEHVATHVGHAQLTRQLWETHRS